MNTHPIDPQKPRGGFLVTIHRSAGSTTKYARDENECQEIKDAAWSKSSTQHVWTKEIG